MSSSRLRHSSSSAGESTAWQDKLEEACREYNYSLPAYQIVSDRRGGRTAWSSRVTISGQTISGQILAARFWYDGKNLNNAKEDAAEVALGWIMSSAASASPSSSRNGW